ncbi:MAG TPA: TonB-dependent receptor [Vicinamibacterales bacterium]|nr:TonB-dependent receptor [Vicinamibacterales bacterium]
MPRHIPALLACILFVAAGTVHGQTLDRAPLAVTKTASAASGRIRGVVRDEAGKFISGANVIAMGTTMALAKSDDRGRFTLPLPPGEYVLRATRQGYISQYREPVRVQTSVQLERNITLIRLDESTAQRTMLAAMGGSDLRVQPLLPAPPDAKRDDHPHSEAAWRLRHLTRTILRDGRVGAVTAETVEAADFRRSSTFIEALFGSSARAAASFFGSTDFEGQVNLVTTSLVGEATDWRPDNWSRGIAYVAVGGPVGAAGDWRVRGAMTPGDLSSWVLLGEYEARAERRHQFIVGMSYGAQGDMSFAAQRRSAVSETRSVGTIYGLDRYRVTDAVEIEYGLRMDRYDYVAAQDLLSPRLGTRVRVLPRTSITGSAWQRVIGPGANEFLPPGTSGPWLPPERTFSTLLPDSPFRTEKVRQFAVGLTQDVGVATSVSFERFRQDSENQIATLFGLDPGSDLGHYYVATAGGVQIDGWQVGLAGRLLSNVHGGVSYIVSDAAWSPGADARAVRWLVPSASRTTERLHDVSMSLDASFPSSATSLSFAARLSSGYSRARSESREPTFGGRFDIEVRQALPYQPIRGGQLEAVFAVRNLFMDSSTLGSIYDELLTLAPPTRIMGGVQIRF